MKDLIHRISTATCEQWIGFVFCCFLFALLVMAVKSLAADHLVRCYYLKAEMTNAGMAYKIMADIDWMEDIKSFATSDGDRAITVISSMKQCSVE